jgi:hypothetical protein
MGNDARVQYTRLYADEQGESHFEDVEVDVQPSNYAPPAPPLSLSVFEPATKYGFAVVARGWYGDWHPTPVRQLRVILSGEVEDESSDGTVRRHGAGSVLQMLDTHGRGHRTRALTEVLGVHVQLPT